MKNKDRYNLLYLNFDVCQEYESKKVRNLMRIYYKNENMVEQIYITKEPIKAILDWLERDFEDF